MSSMIVDQGWLLKDEVEVVTVRLTMMVGPSLPSFSGCNGYRDGSRTAYLPIYRLQVPPYLT